MPTHPYLEDSPRLASSRPPRRCHRRPRCGLPHPSHHPRHGHAADDGGEEEAAEGEEEERRGEADHAGDDGDGHTDHDDRNAQENRPSDGRGQIVSTRTVLQDGPNSGS